MWRMGVQNDRTDDSGDNGDDVLVVIVLAGEDSSSSSMQVCHDRLQILSLGQPVSTRVVRFKQYCRVH